MAYMTFDVRDSVRFSKVRLNDSRVNRVPFNIDFGSNRIRYYDKEGNDPETGKPWTQTVWVKGQFVINGKANDHGALFYRTYNVAAPPSTNIYTYDIVTLEEDLLILCLRAANSSPYWNNTAFFWRFRPYTPPQ